MSPDNVPALPIRLEVPLKKILLQLLVAIAITAGFLVYRHYISPQGGYPSVEQITFSILSALIIVGTIFYRALVVRMRCTLTPEGIKFKELPIIAWADIDTAKAIMPSRGRRALYSAIYLKDTDKFYNTLPKKYKRMADVLQQYFGTPVVISNPVLDTDAETTVRWIQHYIAANPN